MSMLAPEPMLETNLFVLEPDLELVTNVLARMEALHLEDAVPEGWAPSPQWTELANRYSGLTARLSDMLGALRCKPASDSEPDIDLRPTHDWRDIDARLLALETRVQSLQRRLKETEQENEKLALGESQVQLLLPLDVPVEDLRGLQYQTVTVGIMPSGNVPRVAEALFQIPFVLIPLQVQKDRALVFATCSTDNAAILDRALKSAFFEPISLPPEALGRPEQALAALKRKAQEIQKRLNNLDEERRKLASELAPELTNL